MIKNKEWVWDSLQLNLTDPNGKTITLTSGEVSDFFMEQCFQEIQEYVKKKEWKISLNNRKVIMVDEALYYFDKDVGKKVYEIEYEVTYVTKWQVLAKNRNEASDIWIEENKQDLVTEDGKDCVCSYVKDYSQVGNTKVIAEIKYNKEDDEVYADES